MIILIVTYDFHCTDEGIHSQGESESAEPKNGRNGKL